MSWKLYYDEKVQFYEVEVDILRNLSQTNLGVLRGGVSGLRCPKDAQTMSSDMNCRYGTVLYWKDFHFLWL